MAMKTVLNWKQNMQFTATSDGNSILMDGKAPIGHNTGMTPKELVVAGIGGCTAMDVIALLKKHKQETQTMTIEVDVDSTTGKHPAVFTEARIVFDVTGGVDANILMESVRLSQTKFCGVSAMLSKAFPIKYVVRLNGQEIGQGQAEFTE
jgi:putative redox protein